ncbi:GNAT family N-acetyltransferase [Neiella sp. HB171785]|uniref:GNAT family N-acetyltransferase n=1 Tax=Neiella litorisoli TaxID=2771431 RepID=A0A8J6QUY4_9GAMM|nr:GNAT family N-acetyltransferase [Neiella litorisoli]MBD1390577.1 GNAT family N-acetyltransferase [Neiella litorisoli]
MSESSQVATPPATDIELTPEWQDCLYRHCFSTADVLRSAEANGAIYRFIQRANNYGFTTIAPLRNFFVTLAKPSQQLAAPQHHRICQQVLSQRWHMAEIGVADGNDDFIKNACDFLATNGYPYKVVDQFDNWRLSVKGSFTEYMAQRPSRLKNTIKRKRRKLENDQVAVEFIIAENTEQAKAHWQDYCHVYQQSWKPEEEKLSFIAEFVELAASRGWLRMGLLYFNGVPAAAQIWFVYQGKANIFKLAYCPKQKTYSPGTLLTAHLMAHVFDHDRVAVVDFGMGDEPYKADWMSERKVRQSIIAFNHRSFFGKLAQFRYQLLPRIKHRLQT